MAQIDKSYKKLLEEIKENGFEYLDPNRKGVTRTQIMDYKLEHDFCFGFPSLTTKEVYFKGAVGEILAFLKGSTSICVLWGFGIRFWDKDFKNYHNYSDKKFQDLYKSWKEGEAKINSPEYDLGKIYPYQLRSWNSRIDQIYNVIKTLKTNPMATKKTITMWNPSLENQKDLALTQCHWSFEVLTKPLEVEERLELFSNKLEGVPIGWRNKIDLDKLKIPKYGLKIKWHQHSVDTFLG